MVRFMAVMILVMLAVLPLSASANDGIPANCEYTSGEYFQANLFPRYEYAAKQVVLVDWSSGDIVRVLENELDTPEFTLRAWSPDCRYIAASLRSHYDTDLVVWDTITGTKVGMWTNLYLYHVTWSPRSDELVVETRQGAFLWRPAAGQQIQLNNYYGCVGRSFADMQWEYGRNQLIAVQMDFTCRYENGPIMIYDLITGAEVRQISGSQFLISPDNSRIIGIRSTYVAEAEVYNRDTQTSVSVNAGKRPTTTAISPDNRYLVMANVAIRVWDLTNLPENYYDRDPIYRHEGPKTYIDDVAFVDNTTVETIDVYGVVQRWNILTGEELSADVQ